MGLFSSIKKGLKKIVHGVGKVFKKIGKGIQKFMSSKFGKFAMLALAIYTGGAAAGMWSTPWSSAAAVTTTAAPQVAALPTATELAAQGAAATAPLPTAAVAGAEAVGAALPTGAELAAQGAAGAGGTFAPSVVQAAQTPGFLSQIGSGLQAAGTFAAENPMLTYGAGQMLQSAFAPDPVEQQLELERKRREAANFYGITGAGEGTAIGGWMKPKGLVGAAGGSRYG